MATAANGNAAPDAGALAKAYELGAQGRAPILGPDGGQYIALPPDWELEKIPPLEQPLTHVKHTATLYEIDAFIDYVKRFKTEATRIFAAPGHLNGGQATVKAVLDFHKDAATPGHKDHNAVFNPPYSDEWARWAALEKKGNMKQAEWAEMIEENRKDIHHPAAGALLDLIRRFKATKEQSYDSLDYQPDGSYAINWQDKTKGGAGTIPVPEQIVLGIPVYYTGTGYKVEVFMRYRLSEGHLFFHIKRDRPDIIEDAAFKEITSIIQEKTGVTVYLGRP